jgi:type III secretion protein Q
MNEAFLPPIAERGERKNAVGDGLPYLPVALLDVHNQLFAARRPFGGSVGERRISVRIEAWRNPPADTVRLVLQATATLAELFVPNIIASELLSGLTVAGASASEETHALLLELAVVDLMERLEAAFGEQVHLAAGLSANDLPIGVTLQVTTERENAFDLHVKLPADVARMLGEIFPSETVPPLSSMAALPFPVTVLAGATVLTMTELRSLRPGDIVLFDDRPASGAIAVFGERYMAPVYHQGNSLVLASTLQRITGADRIWAPDDTLERNGIVTTNAPDMASLDDLPVRVHFEVGRQEMTLHELRSLTGGSILPVAPLIDEAVNIVANGRVIGRGTITRLGEGLGVVITRLSGDE